MAQENTEFVTMKQRKFQTQEARLAKMNHTTLTTMTIIEGFLVFVFLLQFAVQGSGKALVTVPPIILFGGGIIANWIVYLKNKSSHKFRIVAMAVFMLGYAWLNLSGGASYVVMYVLPILFCIVLYSDKTFARVTGILGIVIMLARLIANAVTIGFATMGNDVIMIVVTMMCFIFAWITANSHKKFEHDMRYTMLDEQKLQHQMLDDILYTVQVAQKEIQEAVEEMNRVSDSNEVMNQSLQEIAAGSLSTAESIQDQTVMTENIRCAIEVTDENAAVMATVASDSARKAKESTSRMEEMERQAGQIEESGAELAAAMQQLKDKVAEVNNITQVIFSISNQTNLLALNASIESARAGEAGRGFAVVADQIRQLAEQTKKSTEQIAGITSQLTAEADVAAELVEKSVSATTEQKNLIVQNVEAFEMVARQSDEAANKAVDLDNEITRLREANSKIVESIAQLSAVSEEVTANTQQATELSDNNVLQMRDAAAKITKVKDTIMELKKYQEAMRNEM